MKTFHTFVDWGKQYIAPENRWLERRFLEGSFIIEREGRRHTEHLETPGALALRLKLYPGQARA
jgi:hypothetical protein